MNAGQQYLEEVHWWRSRAHTEAASRGIDVLLVFAKESPLRGHELAVAR